MDIVGDVPYRPTGRKEHMLDVYRAHGLTTPAPVVLYIHGGGFRILSKETHWLMAAAFARRGYLVFNINYRLAPADPFPAAVEDASAALTWVHAHAADYGGDPDRIVLAGESAGGNLVTALAIGACYDRPEPYTVSLREMPVPVAVLPACGLLQTTDVARVRRRRPKMSRFVQQRLQECETGYLAASAAANFDLADPLLVLEAGRAPLRALPPFMAICGTRDPLLDDTRRLGAALDRLGVDNEVRVYPGEVHAFHAFLWRPEARRAWGDMFAFLGRQGLPCTRVQNATG
jgi:acetyl esterase